MNYKRTKNYYLTERKFLSFAYWKDEEDMFVLFPSLMWKRNQDRGLEIVISQYIFLWGKRKWEIDIGNYFPRKEDFNWNRLKMDDFLSWSKKNIDETITKEYIELVLEENKLLRKALSKTGHNFHYMTLLLEKEIRKFKELNDLSPEMLTQKESMSIEEKKLAEALYYKEEERDPLDLLSTVVEENKDN